MAAMQQVLFNLAENALKFTDPPRATTGLPRSRRTSLSF